MKLNESTQRKHEQIMRKLLAEGRFEDFNKLANEHRRLLQIKEERVTDLGLSAEDKEQANRILRVICILTDIVESKGVDLLSLLRRYDSTLELPLLMLVKNLSRTAREVNKIIDDVGSEEYSASFGDVVDAIEPAIVKTIDKLFDKRKV